MADADKQAGSKAAPASETVVTEKPHDYDSENHSAELNPQERTLKRQLKNRHVAMIRYALRTLPRLHAFSIQPAPVLAVCTLFTSGGLRQ